MRRLPKTTDPGALACRFAVQSEIFACFGPTLAVTSACIISAITRRPTPTLIANNPARTAPATSLNATLSSSESSGSSGASSRSTTRTTGRFLMAVPFLVGCSWQYARHHARGTVSGGGPPSHFNKTRDNLRSSAAASGAHSCDRHAVLAGSILACNTPEMETTRHLIGDATLVRVPYADVLVDAAVVGLTADQVTAIDWASPTWAEHGQVRVGAAVWIIESCDRRIVVDPAQAADGILRTGPDAAVHQQGVATALTTAGYPRDSIDTVIASHIDGIGMIAWLTNDRWSPFFPNAEMLISRREYEAISEEGPYRPQGSDALLALHAQGTVTTVDDEHVVTSEVMTNWTGAHSPGHQIVNIASHGVEATMIGHLALTPLHCATGDCALHLDGPAAAAVLRDLRNREHLLVGPLWPTPGAARWTRDEMQAAPPDPRT